MHELQKRLSIIWKKKDLASIIWKKKDLVLFGKKMHEVQKRQYYLKKMHELQKRLS